MRGTSHEAREHNRRTGAKARHRDAVIITLARAHLGGGGMTDEEVYDSIVAEHYRGAERLPGPSSIRTRRSEWAECSRGCETHAEGQRHDGGAPYVEDSGARRDTKRGTPAVVWGLTSRAGTLVEERAGRVPA